jgi:formylmethanofuran dehydrogenase subunit E
VLKLRKANSEGDHMLWYYEEDGVQIGPLTETEFEQKVMAGRITQQTMVWNDSLGQWQPYSTVMLSSAVSSKKLCSQCGQSFSESELVRYENSLICAKCKPIFFKV